MTDACGHKGIFILEEYFAAMHSVGTYEAACNPFWVDPRDTPTRGTPVNLRAMNQLHQAMFPGPERATLPMVIAVPSKDYNPLEHRGALLTVSPPEAWQCQLKACAEVITSGDYTQETMHEWAASFLTTSFKFEILPTEDSRYGRSLMIRRLFFKQATSLSRTTLQDIIDRITTRWLIC